MQIAFEQTRNKFSVTWSGDRTFGIMLGIKTKPRLF